MAGKQKAIPKYKRPEVPSKFCRGGMVCETVKQLIALLQLLPPDLPMVDSEFAVLSVGVVNNGIDSPGKPYVDFNVADGDDF